MLEEKTWGKKIESGVVVTVEKRKEWKRKVKVRQNEGRRNKKGKGNESGVIRRVLWVNGD